MPRTFLAACFFLLQALAVLLPAPARAAYGVITDTTYYTVDTGAGLVFKVHRTDGSIRSIKYNGGPELQDQSKWSHLGSGYGSVTSTLTTYGSGTPATDDDYIKIACATSASNSYSPNLTHYFLVRRGHNVLYMATYLTQQPGVGEFRWITRLQTSPFPDSPVPSNIRGNVGDAESTDVKKMADGTTRSKYYGDPAGRSKDRALDLTYSGVSGPGVGVFMIYGSRESSSGGPFYRDIQNQSTEVYNYMNSGHVQTESPRVGVLHGPYALVFTSGGAPAYPLDFSWIDTAGFGLLGHVPPSGRGTVSGTVSGIPSAFPALVGFSNATAQYWARPAANGSYTCPGMKPGTYTVRLYKDELAVPLSTGATTVTVTAGSTATLNLASAESYPAHIFKLGEWDGTPAGFLNFENLIAMHPSDPRQAPWGPVNHTVESNSTADFPAIQFRLANSPATLRFTLTATQAASARTLRVGITCALYGGRPQIKVNNRWTSSTPSASTQPDGRCFTLGTWRGNNATFTYSIPASAFNSGANSLTIGPVSGSSDLGTWLSAGYAFDCIQLDGPPALPPVPAGLRATPGDARVTLAWDQVYNATSYTIQRGSSPSGPFTTLGTSPVAAFTDTTAANLATHHYVVRASNSAGAGAASTAVSATPIPLVAFANPGFELPVTPTFQYNPSGASWTFSGASPSGSGISADASAFTSSNAAAPEGAQVAFLQSLGGIAQTLSNLHPGQYYRISFLAAQRNRTQAGQTWDLSLDGTTFKSFAPPQSATAYTSYHATFQATAATHLLAFVGTRSGDNTVFLDDVRITRIVPPAGLVWQGDASVNRWDFSAPNWLASFAPTAFTNGQALTFDDDGSASPSIKLAATVSPASVHVSGNQAYTFTGPGSLAGPATLRKSGPGTLSIATANTYSGGTTLEGGDLLAAHATALGTGPVAITAPDTTTTTRLLLAHGVNLANPLAIHGKNTAYTGAVLVPGANDSATLSGPVTIHPGVNGTGGTFAGPSGTGLLSFTGPLHQSSPTTGPSVRRGRVRFSGGGTATAFAINQDTTSLGAPNGLPATSALSLAASGPATLDLNGHPQTFTGLTRGGHSATVTNSAATPATLTLALATDQSYDGDFSGTLALLKDGPATLTLRGVSTHSGGTTVLAGNLAVDIPTTPLPVAVANPGLETPAIADDTATGLTGATWSSSTTPGETGGGSCGLARGTTTWGSPSADGEQYAYIWHSGQLSQPLTLPAGTATLSFLLAGRPNKTPVDLDVRLLTAGVPTTLGTFASSTQTAAWTERTLTFTVPADGTYTLAFAARQPAGATDWGSNLDAIELSVLPATVRALPSTAPVTLATGATLDLQGTSLTLAGLAAHAPGSTGTVKNSSTQPATLSLDTPSAQHHTYAGTVLDNSPTLGTLSLRKRGPGTQTFSTPLTHRGPTTLEAGLTRLAAPLVNSALTIAPGGTLAPLGAPSVFSLNLASGGALAFTLSPTATNRLVTGSATLAGTANITLSDSLAFGRFPLLTTTGPRTGTLTLGTVTPAVPARLVHQSGQVLLVLDDSDDDGLPDTWEQQHLATLATGPTDDPDADGTPNLAEYRLGLDPASPASAFRVTLAPDARTLTWPSAPGLTFIVQRTFDLAAPAAWTDLATVPAPASGATATYQAPDPAPSLRAFYRISVTP